MLLATVKNSFALVYSANLLKRCDIILTCIVAKELSSRSISEGSPNLNGTAQSQWLKVTNGVPQGSVLGLLLFLLY